MTIAKMRENAKGIMLTAILYKETQIDRSISSLNTKQLKKFRKELSTSIKRLKRLVDNKKIKNTDIRWEISNLSKRTGVTIGQSQKVINVYLKFYCLILNKPQKIIEELDCPLDSVIMKKRQTMNGIKTMNEYEEWQNRLGGKDKIKLLSDLKWDNERIRNFRNPKRKRS